MIPHCDDLFLRFFDPWYSPADRKRRIFEATRPDTMRFEDRAIRSALSSEAQAESAHRIETMLNAAKGDWPRYLYLTGEPDLRWVDTFDEYYDSDQIAKILRESDPNDFSNSYLVTCCEFGAVLAHVLKSMQPRLEWYYEWPYWESALFDSRSGYLIPTFHWSVKKMSDYGVEDGFAAKIEMCLHILDQ